VLDPGQQEELAQLLAILVRSLADRAASQDPGEVGTQ
jgi:hypothetical protein